MAEYGEITADTVTSAMRVHHVGNMAMAGLVPAAYFTPAGSQLQKPVDLALGVVAPVHSHITMNMVLSDYCPPALRGVARAGLLGVTGVALVGLFKLNVEGPGITGALRQLWAPPAEEKPAH